MAIRTLIVDDEPLARQRLRTLLAQESDVTVLGECSSSAEAVTAICSQTPDVVFLDIQMPETDGLELLAAVPAESRPFIIYVTSHREHTLAAFELGAVDYLLKPFKPARFRQAVARARTRLQERSEHVRPAEATTPPAYLRRLIVRLNEHQLIVPTAEIDWMESASNYIVLHTRGESHVLRDTLGSLEERLSPAQFLRVSRFAIVNIDRIRKLKPTETGDHVVVMADNSEVPLTRGIREVQARLEFS
jgi:two-component system LytT family response regulator